MKEVPHDVLFIKAAAHYGIPVGHSIYEKTLTDYPEYFPEETERKRKWALVPQDVHDAYWVERRKINDEMSAKNPSKGIVHWMDNPGDLKEWEIKQRELDEVYKPKFQAIHDKHYSKYGL